MRGGVRLEGRKQASLVSWTIRRPDKPGRIRIPLQFSSKSFARPLVQEGDHVLIGQTVAEPADKSAVFVHSGVAGTVTAIDVFAHPIFEKSKAIEITADRKQESAPGIGKERPGWESISPADFLTIAREYGLVDLTDGMRALHTVIEEASSRKASTLIINACESEPYLTADHSLMLSHPMEILKGAEIIRRAVGASRVIIAAEEDKTEPAEILKSKIFFLKWKNYNVHILPSWYPQEHPDVLRHVLSEKESAYEKREESLILNLATAFAFYEAVAFQKPFYERAVTIGGECVVESRNVWITIGTGFDDAFKTCRGLLREPGRILMNGPMRGTAQTDRQVPVIAGTRAVLAISKEAAAQHTDPQPCIRCGWCIETCPAGLSPVMITLAVENNLWDIVKDYEASRCIECGVCSYVCPSSRPMLEWMQTAVSHCELSGAL